MELLINFTPADDDTQMVFIYSRKIEAPEAPKKKK
jgi:hypothetical protein